MIDNDSEEDKHSVFPFIQALRISDRIFVEVDGSIVRKCALDENTWFRQEATNTEIVLHIRNRKGVYSKNEEGKYLVSQIEASLWTTNRVIDELHYHLETLTTDRGQRCYEEQAKKKIYKIPIFRPVPSFIISKRDLTERLLKELSSYDEEARQQILKTSVGRIFENIDQRYYIQSVKQLLIVALGD